MKIYRIAQHIYHYHINCISARARDIEEMVDNSREVSYNTFMRHVDINEIKEIFPIYGWGKNKDSVLKLRNDYAVSYYRSKYRGQPCLYIKHSAIEYVFI
jgi:hypothetical protein